MHNIMLDLETLGTSPNAAVIAIGACFFDIETCEIGATFYRVLDLDGVVRSGGEMDASTVLWWLKQSDDARQAIYAAENLSSPGIAMAHFSRFIADNASQDPLVWGNGANFDNVILASMYRRQGIQLPWKWWNDRCYRTIKQISPKSRAFETERLGTKHHALGDAMHQAHTLIQLLNPDAERSQS